MKKIIIIIFLFLPLILNAQSESNDRFFDSFETLTDTLANSPEMLPSAEMEKNYMNYSKQCDSLILVGDTLTIAEVDSFLWNDDDRRQYVRLRKAKVKQYYVLFVYYRSEANNEKGVDVYTYLTTSEKTNEPRNRICAVRCKLNEDFSLWYGVGSTGVIVGSTTKLSKICKFAGKEYTERRTLCGLLGYDTGYFHYSEDLR